MKANRFAAALLAALMLAAGAAVAEEQSQDQGAAKPPPCSAPEYRQFDFWLGDWEVRDPKGKVVGHNTIEKILDGCVLRESWEGVSGSVGHSFNGYRKRMGTWHQTWVDNQGLVLVLDGGLKDGSMVLEGDILGRDGATVHNRITWTPNEDGSVRQHWQMRKEGEEDWRTVFDGTYTHEGS